MIQIGRFFRREIEREIKNSKWYNSAPPDGEMALKIHGVEMLPVRGMIGAGRFRFYLADMNMEMEL